MIGTVHHIKVNVTKQWIDTKKELPDLSQWIKLIIEKSNELRAEYKNYIDSMFNMSHNTEKHNIIYNAKFSEYFAKNDVSFKCIF